MSTEHVITRVGEEDLDELLPLLRGYCDFYEVSPSDEALLALSRALIADPEREGVQLIAREARGSGLAERLIAACRERAAGHGARELAWQTAKDNHRAQAVYDRIGGTRSEWYDYSLAVPRDAG